jgi:hypothetical protein
VLVSLTVEVVQAGGKEEIGEPIYWPVYAAVDDAALRFLIGDVTAQDWLEAPGPLGKGEAPAWRREIGERGVAGGGYVGFGLLYSEGGSSAEPTQAAYQALIATLHALVIGHVARTSGLKMMLRAFGGRAGFDDKPDGVDLDLVRDGVDPEVLREVLDDDLVTGLDAFRGVGASLLPFAQGGVGGSSGVRVSTPSARLRPVAPPPERRFDPGTVVAATVQAWRLADIAEKGVFAVHRELRTRVELSGALWLAGQVTRDMVSADLEVLR